MNADPNKQREEHAPQSDLNALLPLMQMRNMVGYLYGSEDISLLFYALIRREKPQNLIELGTGVGVTALWMAQACKENGTDFIVMGAYTRSRLRQWILGGVTSYVLENAELPVLMAR